MADDPKDPQYLLEALPALLTENDLAKRWNKSVRTLQRWRAAGVGPSYIQIGGSARYRVDQILSYENANKSDSGNTRGQSGRD